MCSGHTYNTSAQCERDVLHLQPVVISGCKLDSISSSTETDFQGALFTSPSQLSLAEGSESCKSISAPCACEAWNFVCYVD